MAGGRVGFQFFPSPESERVVARIVMAAGTPQSRVQEIVATVEASLERAVAEIAPEGEKLVRASFTELGKSGDTRGTNAAEMTVHLTASEVRTVRTRAIFLGLAQTGAGHSGRRDIDYYIATRRAAWTGLSRSSLRGRISGSV